MARLDASGSAAGGISVGGRGVVVDRAVVLGFSPKPADAERAVAEMRRIGLEPEVFWNICGTFQKFIPASMVTGSFLLSPANMSCYLGHYHIVKSALDRGFSSLCVVEDDCRFLKDVGLLHDILAKAPADADYLILGGVPTPESVASMPLSGGAWRQVRRSLDVRSAVCDILLSRRAMEMRVKQLDGSLLGGKLPLAGDVGRDEDTLAGLHVYMAWTPVAIQAVDIAPGRASAEGIYHRNMYARYDIDIANYA